MAKAKAKCIGILTAGGDCPGLNSAIRGVAKSAMHHGIRVGGVLDGFRGLVENRFTDLTDLRVSGILTRGGTILGTSRDKPHKIRMGDNVMDMTDVAVENAKNANIDCLICLGGNGTQKNALKLAKAGLDIITLPKTIDNDVWGTDITFGYDTALNIATEAIDRLHTTATSHHRIIVCELMGHSAGWLTLGAGIAGGADVILIPELPYDLGVVAEHLHARRRVGKRFSIIAVAEGVQSIQEVRKAEHEKKSGAKGDKKKKKKKKDEDTVAHHENGDIYVPESISNRIARELTAMTGIEARMTSLGHVQRGGTPSATDRLLCTRLGTQVGDLLVHGKHNVMVAVRGDRCEAVPLEEAAGKVRLVPANHDWIKTARLVETCFGDAH